MKKCRWVAPLRLYQKVFLATAKNALVALFNTCFAKFEILSQISNLLYSSFILIKARNCFFLLPSLVSMSVTFFAFRNLLGVVRFVQLQIVTPHQIHLHSMVMKTSKFSQVENADAHALR